MAVFSFVFSLDLVMGLWNEFSMLTESLLEKQLFYVFFLFKSGHLFQ